MTSLRVDAAEKAQPTYDSVTLLVCTMSANRGKYFVHQGKATYGLNTVQDNHYSR